MFNRQPKGRNSEGVVTIRHPRSDFPQQGWIRKASATGGSALYEAITGFGWFSETQSYRSADKSIEYGLRRWGNVRQFYQTEPNEGWQAKPVLTLYEHNTGFGWWSQTQVTGITRAHPSRDLDRWDQEYTSWETITLFDPATEDWQIKSSRTLEPSRSRTRRDTYIDAAWIFPNLVVAFDPATLDWHIATSRIPDRLLSRVRRDTNTDTSWLSAVNPITGWTFPDVRSAPGLRYQRDTNYDTAFIPPGVQSWDIPADRLAKSTAVWKLDTSSTLAWVVSALFDPAVSFPALTQQTDSFRNVRDCSLHLDGSKRPSSSGGTPAEIIPFDPSTQPWTLASHRHRLAKRPPLSWTHSGYFVSLYELDPAMRDWQISAHLGRSTRRYTRDARLMLTLGYPAVVITEKLYQRSIRGNDGTGQDDWTISYRA